MYPSSCIVDSRNIHEPLAKLVRISIMSFSRLRATRAIINNTLRVAVRNGGGGHHGPSVPPFARNAPPSGKVILLLDIFFYLIIWLQLPQDFELVWDDGVAPETTIDFDAESLDLKQAVAFWLSGFVFFFLASRLVKSTDPEGRNPIVIKQETMNKDDFHYFLGLGKPEEYLKAGAEEE